MMPVMYEIWRTLRSKTVIILTLVVIAISVFTALNSASPAPQAYDQSIAYGYGSNGTYILVVHISNGQDQAVQNSKVMVQLGNNSSLTGYSNAEGYANFTLSEVNRTTIANPYNNSNWYLQYNFTDNQGIPDYGLLTMYRNYSNPYFFETINQIRTISGTTENVSQNESRYYMSSYPVINHPDENDLSILYRGPAGGSSPPVELYYYPINRTSNSGSVVPIPSRQNMTFFGTLSGFASLEMNPQNITGSDENLYVFTLYTPQGKSLGSADVTLKTPYTNSQITQEFFDTQMSIMGLFIPLMAALAAYSTYGRDKTGGVLESVLVRPISRKGLISSRYIATALAVFAATFISFLISSLVYEYYLGAKIPFLTFIIGLWSLLVISSAYIGMVFLASSYSKSSSTLLGFAIGIFVVFDFLWTFAGAPVIPSLIVSDILKLSPGSLSYLRDYVYLYYASPAGMPNITSLIITGSAYYVVFVPAYELAELGLTYLYVFVAGLIWIMVPMVLSVFRFMRKD